MSMSKEQAIERMRECFPRGSTVYTVLRHRSRSGLQREIGVVAISSADPAECCAVTIRHPNYDVSDALGLRVGERGDAVKVRGCDMDMGLHIARWIAVECYGDQYALRHEWI